MFSLRPFSFRQFVLSAVAGWTLIAGVVSAADSDPALSAWLAAQANLHSWSAEVTQTRTFKTLTQPLVTHGRIWFATPNFFRWELGEPAQTIALREAGEMLVLYPRLKRAERYPLDTGVAGPWRDLLTLVEAGFPRNQADLEARFKVLSVTQKGELGEVRLQPKSAAGRRMMPELKIIIAAKDAQPHATEMTFADGSTVRNDFAKAVLNPQLDPALFKVKIPDGYKVSEPLRSAPH